LYFGERRRKNGIVGLKNTVQVKNPNLNPSMKTQLINFLTLLALFASINEVAAQGTPFTYQGRLENNGNPAGGSYDFRFKLFEDSSGNTQAGGTVLANGISITNVLFTVGIDFGAAIFNSSNYWLEVDVRTNGTGGYFNLNPLQAVS
jgi:hypothetical protein